MVKRKLVWNEGSNPSSPNLTQKIYKANVNIEWNIGSLFEQGLYYIYDYTPKIVPVN
jgi:hypothetical protein